MNRLLEVIVGGWWYEINCKKKALKVLVGSWLGTSLSVNNRISINIFCINFKIECVSLCVGKDWDLRICLFVCVCVCTEMGVS